MPPNQNDSYFVNKKNMDLEMKYFSFFKKNTSPISKKYIYIFCFFNNNSKTKKICFVKRIVFQCGRKNTSLLQSCFPVVFVLNIPYQINNSIFENIRRIFCVCVFQKSRRWNSIKNAVSDDLSAVNVFPFIYGLNCKFL